MTNSEQAKEYLGQIVKTDALINRLFSTAQRLRLSLTSTSSSISGEKVQASGANSRLEETFCKIDTLEQEINQNIDELIEWKAEAMQRINRLSDFDQRNVLIARYINGLKWEQIAVEINFSMRQVLRIHAAALESFSEILKDGTLCHMGM